MTMKDRMKAFELRELTEQDLRNRLKEEEENLMHLKFQKAISQVESPIKIRTTRRNIAVMKTVLQEIKFRHPVSESDSLAKGK